MTIARAAYVICDRCSSPGPVECVWGARGAREQARSARWTRDGKRDLCPTCSGHNHFDGPCVPGVCPAAKPSQAEPEGGRHEG